MSRRILVLGGAGLLGRGLQRHAPAEVRVLAPLIDDLPLEDGPRLARFLREEAVDSVICLAAWTAVDACEDDPERAFRVNGILPGRLAGMADRLSLPFLFLSTDYVFDGLSGRPYREFDAANPLSVYGRSKRYGERAVREACPHANIVRSAGLYGEGGPDFVQSIRSRLALGPVDVVTDEVNSPTWVDDLAPALWTLALSGESGTWHLTSSGGASRFEQARRIAELSGHDPALIRPTTRDALRWPARRPPYSVLDCQAAREIFGVSLADWDDALARYLGGGRP
jgi:dTDP-4-dehydrorhamnose reductase